MQHQVAGQRWLKERPRAFLGDQMGLGKTGTVLGAIQEPVLALAPAQVLDVGVWDDEIAMWADGADITQCAYTSLTERERTAKGGFKPTKNPRPEYVREWGTIIADEAHHLKGRKTHWTVALSKLKCQRLVLMTGSPIPNWAHEAYVALKLMHPGDKRFTSYWRWAGEWFHVGPTIFSPMTVGEFRDEEHMRHCPDCIAKRLPERTWEEFDQQNFGDKLLRRLRDDVLDLPPLSHAQDVVPLAPEQLGAYADLRDDFVTWLSSGREVAAWTNAAQMTKLARCATGLETLDGALRGSGKLGKLAENLDGRERPTLVVGYFRDTVAACERIAIELGARVATIHGGIRKRGRREAVRGFQSGELDVLCATIDTVAEGMTFTAADRMERIERSWRPSTNEQVEFRLHRIGQANAVTINDLVAEGTTDEDQLALLASKSDQQMGMLRPAELRSLHVSGS